MLGPIDPWRPVANLHALFHAGRNALHMACALYSSPRLTPSWAGICTFKDRQVQAGQMNSSTRPAAVAAARKNTISAGTGHEHTPPFVHLHVEPFGSEKAMVDALSIFVMPIQFLVIAVLAMGPVVPGSKVRSMKQSRNGCPLSQTISTWMIQCAIISTIFYRPLHDRIGFVGVYQ